MSRESSVSEIPSIDASPHNSPLKEFVSLTKTPFSNSSKDVHHQVLESLSNLT
jgi:hypothetical protein